MKSLGKHQGITMLEILITLAILGIFAAVGLPSFNEMLGRFAVNGAVRTMTDTYSIARSEAASRGSDISICPKNTASTDCLAGQWSSGWLIFIDSNEDATGTTGSVDSGDEIIQVVEPLADVVLTATSNLLQYDSRGFGINAAVQTFKFCPEDNNASNAKTLEIGISGRARLIETGITCP